MGLLLGWSKIRTRFAERPSELLGMFCLVNSRNLGKASEHAAISSFPVPAVGGTSEAVLISSGPARPETRQTRLRHQESRMEQRHASQPFPVFLLRSQCLRLVRSRMRQTHMGHLASCMEQ